MIYAIGDIHGHLDKLERAHALIDADKSAHDANAATVVHVGDLVDRGPDSCGVLDFLLDGIRRREEWVLLKGNHDQLFLDVLNGGDGTHKRLGMGGTWSDEAIGGRATMRSYGIEKRRFERRNTWLDRLRASVPEKHKKLLSNLRPFHREEGMIFVHAGIRPGFALEMQDEEDLMWIRDEFLWHTGFHEALVVHGHTPVDQPTHYGNRVNIDTGAGWGYPLVPVVFDGDECFSLTEEGREPIWRP